MLYCGSVAVVRLSTSLECIVWIARLGKLFLGDQNLEQVAVTKAGPGKPDHWHQRDKPNHLFISTARRPFLLLHYFL